MLGRLILGNVVIAYEVLHSLKNKRVKLYMIRAYDRVE